MADRPSSAPAANFVAVTPHDTNVLSFGKTRGISVAAAGNINIRNEAGDAVVIYVIAGVIHGIVTDLIKSTSTTATGIVAYY